MTVYNIYVDSESAARLKQKFRPISMNVIFSIRIRVRIEIGRCVNEQTKRIHMPANECNQLHAEC